MWLYSIMSYIHIAAIFAMFSAIIVEFVFLVEKIPITNIKKIIKADMFFGLFALITVITGVLRLFYFGKGINYYLNNSLFIIKIFTFILVGILSIYPTITFLKLRKEKNELVHIKNFKKIKSLIISEIILLLLIPLLAVLVKNGIGI